MGDFDNLHYCCYEHRDYVNGIVHVVEEGPSQLESEPKAGQCMHPSMDQLEYRQVAHRTGFFFFKMSWRGTIEGRSNSP